MKLLLFIILTLSLTVSFGQSKLNIDKVWNECFDEFAQFDHELYFASKPFCDSSIVELIEIYQNNDSLVIATFFLGQLHFQNKQFEEALKCFQEVQKMKYGKEINKNYKYHATLRIAEIQTINGNFSSAINSLKSTKTKYQFSHFCINSFSYVDYNFDVHLAEIEFQKGNKDDAIDLIQPYLFSNEFNSENTTSIQLIQWLKKDYSEEQINSSLIKSLSDANSFNIDSNEKLEIQVNDLNIQFEIPLSLLDIHSDSLQEMDRRQINNILVRKIEKTKLFNALK